MFKQIILIAALAAAAFGQSEVLTNRTLIEMTAAGLSKEVVIAKIRSAEGRFDTSAQGLIELKKASVEDDVIALLLELQAASPVSQASMQQFSESGPQAVDPSPLPATKKEAMASARSIALIKSSVQPSRQALEKELLKRKDFQALDLAIERYKDTADLYVEIGYVSLSWLTHRYVYRIYDRRSGMVLAAGETTSWGSLAQNLARHISKSLTAVKNGQD